MGQKAERGEGVWTLRGLVLNLQSLITYCFLLFMLNFLLQLEAAKKTYHMACKEEKLATTREANIKGESSVAADQQKKLHEKVDKCKQDSQKVRTSAAAAPASLCKRYFLQ